jgi:large-conductance mechanosensitive channel
MNIQEFSNFVSKYNIIPVGISFLVSNQVNKVFNEIMNNLLLPIVSGLTGKSQEEFQELKVSILGIELQIGRIFFSIIHFVIFLILLFYIIQILNLK